MHTVFLLVKTKEKRELEDIGVDERVKKINLKRTGRKTVDWINLALDRENWRVFTNMVMNIRIPQNKR
jgi:hypothetical protein